MRYASLEKAVFRTRKNRFVAEVVLDDEVIAVHVPNTGRCKELFVAGAPVYVAPAANSKRKYRYTLVAVYKGETLVHIDSAAANRLAEEALLAGSIFGLNDVTEVAREQIYGSSRFDLRFEKAGKTCFMEVKGVTLEEGGIALFPDAPTERGSRHIRELVKAKAEGYGAYLLFVIQMKGVKAFRPHISRDPVFAAELKKAAAAGVEILAYDAVVGTEEIRLDQAIPVDLEEVLKK